MGACIGADWYSGCLQPSLFRFHVRVNASRFIGIKSKIVRREHRLCGHHSRFIQLVLLNILEASQQQPSTELFTYSIIPLISTDRP